MIWLNLLKRFWWIAPIAVLLALLEWRGHELSVKTADLKACEQSLATAAVMLQTQNQAVEALKVQGAKLAAQVKVEQAAREAAAAKVEVKWRTKYVSVPVPQDCPGAVSAGAVNAARLGQLWQSP
jgi:hypothetical protein